jgi:hypothetical protein
MTPSTILFTQEQSYRNLNLFRSSEMNAQVLEDKRTLWIMFYAQRAFEHAQIACAYLIEKEVKTNDPLFYPLCTALVVNYSRPFAKSFGLGKSDFGRKKIEMLVPKKYENLHKSILDNRDRNFAHTDALDNSPNEVRSLVTFNIQGDRMAKRVFLFERTPAPAFFSKALELLQIFHKKTNYHINKIRKKYDSELSIIGESILNIKEESKDFCFPVKKT